MRDYAKVSPKFWTGETGQELARRGSDALVVALYLMTSPHSNMLGLFYQPVLYLAEETGLPPEGASEGLRHCKEAGFCSYDPVTKMVWVYEMASYQVGSNLSPKDLRCKGIAKDYAALPNNPFLGDFFDRYAQDFHLTDRREYAVKEKGLQRSLLSPLQAPSKQGTGEGTGEGTGSKPSALSPAEPATGGQLDLTGDDPAGIPPCPLKQLVGMFVAKVPELPKPRYELWSQSKGADAMRARWKWLLSPDATRDDGSRYATNAAEGVDWFGRFFDAVAESDFLTGRNGAWKNCDLTWLMNRENFMKVVQGNYRRERATA